MSMEKDKDEIVAKLATVWENWIIKGGSLRDEGNQDLIVAAILAASIVKGVEEAQKK